MDLVSENVLLPGLVRRPPELGRIRMGEKGERQIKGRKVEIPISLKTFRLTSASQQTLVAAAALYGGAVSRWDGAPDEGMWQLTTRASELDVLIPSQLAVISQSYELWQGGVCERRCDGTTESISRAACLCAAAAEQLPDLERQRALGPDRPCEIVTRLRIMLPRVPGLGVWRLDTAGYVAATTLPATIELLRGMTPGLWMPAVLRAEQRSKRDRLPDGSTITHRFVVPVLDLPGMTINQAVALAGGVELPALPDATPPPAPKTAADRAASRRALLEQGDAPGTSSPPDEAPAEETAAGVVTAPAAPLVDAAETIFDGDVASSTVEPAPAPKRASKSDNAMVACDVAPDGEVDPTKRCRRQSGHGGPHANGEGSWR